MGLDQVSRVSLDALRNGRMPAAILLLSLGLELAGNTVRTLLRYDRTGIADLELWRLLTGHLVHLGWIHLALNGAGLILLWVLVGRCFTQGQWLAIALVSVAGIDSGLWFLDPDLVWYVGLSGVLHGMLAAGLVPGVRDGNIEAVLLSVLLAAKIGWEQFLGPLPGSTEVAGGNVVVNAHLYGAVSGALAGAVLIRARRPRPI